MVLRSSDNIDFHVHRLILSLVSPVFAAMFSLPQAKVEPNQDNGEGSGDEHEVVTKAGLPVISLPENSQCLEKVLTWCDPRCVPSTDAPLDIQIVLHVADKYGMDPVMDRAKEALRMRATTYPEPETFSVYAIACQHGFEDIARTAATAMLRHKLSELPDVPELQDISGAVVYRLYRYHFACCRIVRQVISDLRWYKELDYLRWTGSYDHCKGRAVGDDSKVDPSKFRAWFAEYVNLATVELSERPCGHTILVQNSSLAQKAISMSKICDKCRPTAHITLETFGKALADEVDRVVGNVCCLVWDSCRTRRID